MEEKTQNQLITKVQYKNFEPGEFTDRRQRTYEETTALIEAFPWSQQRDHFTVSLTGPSVTIEGTDGDFLKLALYYNDKYILYYFDMNQRLYSHTYVHTADAYPLILAFFRQGAAPPDFKHQNTFLQHNISHFKDNDFSYAMRWVTLAGVLGIVGFLLAGTSVLTMLPFLPRSSVSLPFLIMPLVLLILFIFQTALAVNHYKAARGRVLVISRGRDEFSYGPTENPVPYNKKDIMEIITYGGRTKGGYPRLTRVEISFKDGRSINISCLIIPRDSLVEKLAGYPQREDYRLLPFIPSGASSPS
jgi:hypothetical protein